MGVPAQHQIEFGVCRLAIDLRRVRQQDRKPVIGQLRNRLLDVVDPVIVRVVDADDMDALVAAHQGLGFIEQHANPHLLQPGDHADRVVVAEHAEDRPLDLRADPRQSFEGGVERPERLAAIVAGQHAEIVSQPRQQLGQTAHRPFVHIDVQIADLQDR